MQFALQSIYIDDRKEHEIVAAASPYPCAKQKNVVI